jgi:hypothetical protein
MSASINDLVIPFSATVKFNNVDLGALAKDIKLRLKFKETKFGYNNSDYGLAKLIKHATDVEVEFESDNATIANLQKALGGIGTLGSSLVINANTRYKPTPYTLLITMQTKLAGYGYDQLIITITNMVATVENFETTFERAKNIKVPMKFITTSGWSFTALPYTPA